MSENTSLSIQRIPKPLLRLWGGLLVLIAAPVLLSWSQIILNRPLEANLFQILTVCLLITALLKRENLFRLPVYLSRSGLYAITITSCIHLLSAMVAIKSLYWASFIALLATLIWGFFGYVVFYRWLSFFLFSLFLLPQLPIDLQTQLSLQLQLLSTKLTALLAGLIIPITSQGNIFYINNQAYEVTVACSGLHTWIGFLFAGLLWQLFEPFSLKKLGGILLIAPVLAIALNTVRLVFTALIAYWFSPEAGMALHTNIEYLLFPAGLLLMLIAGRRLYAYP